MLLHMFLGRFQIGEYVLFGMVVRGIRSAWGSCVPVHFCTDTSVMSTPVSHAISMQLRTLALALGAQRLLDFMLLRHLAPLLDASLRGWLLVLASPRPGLCVACF